MQRWKIGFFGLCLWGCVFLGGGCSGEMIRTRETLAPYGPPPQRIEPGRPEAQALDLPATPLPETKAPLKETLSITPSPNRSIASFDEILSAHYKATTEEALKSLLIQLDEEDPGSMDGPLAVAMMQETGLLDASIPPHRFWLLNATRDWQRLEVFLPHEDYIWMEKKGALSQINLLGFSFSPGDLVYLIPDKEVFTGKYILITRVDSQGRAFTITNQYLPSRRSFIVDEFLFYDPNQREKGLMGSSGAFGGYQGLILWRKRPPVDISTVVGRLDRVLNRGGIWNVMIKKVGGEVVYSRSADEIVHPASTIKIATGLLVMKLAEAEGIGLDTFLQQAPPKAGRTYAQLLRAMLVMSEETATDLLTRNLKQRMGEDGIRKTLDEWGVPGTSIEPRRTTAREITRLLEGIQTKTLVGPEASDILIHLMEELTENDHIRLWKLAPLLPKGTLLYNKRGSMTGPIIVADAGVLVLPNGDAYILSFIGRADAWTTFEELDAILGDAVIEWYGADILKEPSN